jgi:galactose-1-phosphate uridylyltransferase
MFVVLVVIFSEDRVVEHKFESCYILQDQNKYWRGLHKNRDEPHFVVYVNLFHFFEETTEDANKQQPPIFKKNMFVVLVVIFSEDRVVEHKFES